MNYLLNALCAEGLKIYRSRIIWITLAAFSIAPLMGGFFMFILKNPEFAVKSGLLGAKAQIAGEAHWPSYFNLIAQIIAVGGMLIFGFVTSWTFGREYTDLTAKDLLALPCSRAFIVIAKFMSIFITDILLSTHVVILGLLIGWIIDLPQWSSTILINGLIILIVTTVLTQALCTPVAFFASYGKGYLAPTGFVVFMLVLSQMVAAIGYGEYFPWAIPAVYSGIAGVESHIKLSSFLIVLITSLSGFIGTLSWWIFADQY